MTSGHRQPCSRDDQVRNDDLPHQRPPQTRVPEHPAQRHPGHEVLHSLDRQERQGLGDDGSGVRQRNRLVIPAGIEQPEECKHRQRCSQQSQDREELLPGLKRRRTRMFPEARADQVTECQPDRKQPQHWAGVPIHARSVDSSHEYGRTSAA